MGRRVPEAAPLVGLVLAAAFALFGFLFSPNHLATVLVAVLLLYPFVAFGVARSASPADAIPPDPVLAAGVLATGVVSLYGLAVGQFPFGVLVASVVGVPPALYHARVGESVNPLPPDVTFGCGLLVAATLGIYGATVGQLAGSLAAVVVGFGAVDYRQQRGGALARRTRSIAVLGCLGGGLVVAVGLAGLGRPSAGLAAGGVLVAIGAFLTFGEDR